MSVPPNRADVVDATWPPADESNPASRGGRAGDPSPHRVVPAISRGPSVRRTLFPTLRTTVPSSSWASRAKPGIGRVPVDDHPPGRRPLGHRAQERATLTLHDRVLQGHRHIADASRRSRRPAPRRAASSCRLELDVPPFAALYPAVDNHSAGPPPTPRTSSGHPAAATTTSPRATSPARSPVAGEKQQAQRPTDDRAARRRQPPVSRRSTSYASSGRTMPAGCRTGGRSAPEPSPRRSPR